MRRPQPTEPWPALSVALLAIGVAAVAVLHLMRRDLSPGGHRLSEYTLGHHGWLMVVAFVAIGTGLLALTAAIVHASGRRRLVAALVAVAGIGMVVSGAFRTDTERSGETADTVHSAASGLATMALIAAATLWAWRTPRRTVGGAGRRGDRPRGREPGAPPHVVDRHQPAGAVGGAAGLGAARRRRADAGSGERPQRPVSDQPHHRCMNVFTTPLVATLAALALVAACSDEDRRELGEVDLRDSLTNQVTDAVAAQDLELDGDLQCTATIATDGTATRGLQRYDDLR